MLGKLWLKRQIINSISEDTKIGAGTEIMGKNLRTCSHVYIGRHCFLDATDWIVVNPNVTISRDVTILTHDRNDMMPVYVKDGAFIGARATILLGVTIGRNAVVGAGTTVSKDVPEGATVVSARNRVTKK